MADSSVDVTPGAGASVDTRTESTNGNHRQVVVIGDPSTNAGVAPVDATNGLAVDLKGDGLTSLQLIDDAIVTDDAAFTPGTTKVMMAGFEYDDSGTDSVNEGDAGAARMSSNRNIYFQIRDGSGNAERGASVDASNNLAVFLGLPIPAGTNNIGDVDVLSIVPGTGATALGKAIDSAVGATDTGVASLAVRDDALSTLTPAESDYVPLRTDSIGALWTHPTDTIAHDAADAGNGIKVALKAKSSLTGITLVADADRSDIFADLDGVQIMKPYAPYGNILSERVTNTDGSSTALSTFGASANLRNFITTAAVFNSSSTDGYVDLRDGTGGSVIFTLPAPKGGGSVVTFPVPLRQPTANTALAFDVSGAISTIYLSFVGFQSKA